MAILDLIFGFFLYFHPHHQSITDIEYQVDDKIFEISMTLTAHDMEKLLSIRTLMPVDLSKKEDSLRNSELLFNYIEKNFHITLDNIHADLEFLGFENEKDELSIYLQTEEVDHITDYLRIENTVLMDYHEEQQNIIHLKYHNVNESKKLTLKKSKMEIKI